MKTFENIPSFEVYLDTERVELETETHHINFDVELETVTPKYIPATQLQPAEGGSEIITGTSFINLEVFDIEGDPVVLTAEEGTELINSLKNKMIIS